MTEDTVCLTAEEAAMLLPYAQRMVEGYRKQRNDQLLHSPQRAFMHERIGRAAQIYRKIRELAEGHELPAIPTHCPDCGVHVDNHVDPRFHWKWVPCGKVRGPRVSHGAEGPQAD